MDRRTPENYQAIIASLEADVVRLTTALNLIDEARAKAVAEIEEVHRYLDECYINSPDEGRAVPLIDRVVLLVSRWAKDEAAELELSQERFMRQAAEAEAARLRAALELAAKFVAKAHADGAYDNTAMSGERALAKINAALTGDNSDQDAA